MADSSDRRPVSALNSGKPRHFGGAFFNREGPLLAVSGHSFHTNLPGSNDCYPPKADIQIGADGNRG